jgi:hypothetical protein
MKLNELKIKWNVFIINIKFILCLLFIIYFNFINIIFLKFDFI